MKEIKFPVKRFVAFFRILAHRVDNNKFMLIYVRMLNVEDVIFKSKFDEFISYQKKVFDEKGLKRDFFSIYKFYKSLPSKIRH